MTYLWGLPRFTFTGRSSTEREDRLVLATEVRKLRFL